MQSVNKSHCQEPIGLQGESVLSKMDIVQTIYFP